MQRKPGETALGRVTSSHDLYALLTADEVGLPDVLAQSLQFPDEAKAFLDVLAAHSLNSREFDASLSGTLLAVALAILHKLISHNEAIQAWLLQAAGILSQHEKQRVASVISAMRDMSSQLSHQIASSIGHGPSETGSTPTSDSAPPETTRNSRPHSPGSDSSTGTS